MKTIYFILVETNESKSHRLERFIGDELPDFMEWCVKVKKEITNSDGYQVVVLDCKIIKY